MNYIATVAKLPNSHNRGIAATYDPRNHRHIRKVSHRTPTNAVYFDLLSTISTDCHAAVTRDVEAAAEETRNFHWKGDAKKRNAGAKELPDRSGAVGEFPTRKRWRTAVGQQVRQAMGQGRLIRLLGELGRRKNREPPPPTHPPPSPDEPADRNAGNKEFANGFKCWAVAYAKSGMRRSY